MSTAIVWDPNNVLFHLGSFFTIKWYNFLFAATVVVAAPIWQYMFQRAGKERHEAEQLQIYIVLGVMAGARLGHVLFYGWSYFKDHLSEIFLPVVWSPTFQITGFSGLASHGAVWGVMLVLFFYAKRLHMSLSPMRIYLTDRKPKGTLLWILDHLVILVALGGSFVRIGNFTNSEIIGKPTGRPYGVVFVKDAREELEGQYASLIQQFVFQKADKEQPLTNGHCYQPLKLMLTFKESIKDEKQIRAFLEGSFKHSLLRLSNSTRPMIYEPYGSPLCYTLSQSTPHGDHQATVHTWGILRHPSQLYESLSCLLLFICLGVWWYAKGQTILPGRLTGAFALVAFALRFFYEFYKENQEEFESNLYLNMGQLLSLPFIVLGLFLTLRPIKRQNAETKV